MILTDTRHTSETQLLSPSASQPTFPSLAKLNATVLGGQWRMVTCPDGHMTHAFLACDVSVSCWAGNDVIFSLHPHTWALPTPQSCSAPLAVTSLPPSFPCPSGEWRVPYSLVCDHRPDCQDGSDETFCLFSTCHESHFQCLNKQVSCALV